MTDNGLVEKAIKIQSENKLSDRQFSARLGVDPANWCRVKNRQKEPGMKLLTALIREFPQLQLPVFEFMATKADNTEKGGIE